MVGEAADGAAAVRLAGELQPDVVLMDLVMPGLDGIEAIRRITAQDPGARILLLTSFAGDEKLFPAIQAGALGYLLKDSAPEELVRAIRQIYQGVGHQPEGLRRSPGQAVACAAGAQGSCRTP